MTLWSLLWLVRWRFAVTPEVAPHRLMRANSSPLARMLTFWDCRCGDSCRPIISVSAPHAAAGASLQTVQYACILGSVVEGRQRWIQWYRCCTVNRRFWGDLEAWRAMTNGANWGYHTSSSPRPSFHSPICKDPSVDAAGPDNASMALALPRHPRHGSTPFISCRRQHSWARRRE